MNLKQLGELVDGFRACGIHGLTDVVIREDSVGSEADIGEMRLDRGQIVITPAHAEVQQPAPADEGADE